jgi:hypothetical protein
MILDHIGFNVRDFGKRVVKASSRETSVAAS